MSDLSYLTGYGNHLASEALPGALPTEQNAPQHAPLGLYAEQINGTGFTVRRAENQRVWLYRLRPAIGTRPWERLPKARFTAHFGEGSVSPELLRFAPVPWPDLPVDWLDGLSTFAGAGDPGTRTGMALHTYAASADMHRAFTCIDGDLLIVPQDGRLRLQTELGWLELGPGHVAILPRGIRFRVLLPDGRARGFVSEVYNGHHQLPERGLVGANGLADERHFQAPTAAFEDAPGPYEVVVKQGGDLWRTEVAASPFDVVAWHGRYLPFQYDLMRFAPHWSVLHDHPDPSILTALTVPHDDRGRNALDVAVFRGRWDPTEHTFRPPYLHRNSAVEFNAVLRSPATDGPYRAGAFTYTPYLTPHGVSAKGDAKERQRTDDSPRRLADDELWIQWESTYQLRVMPWFRDASFRDHGYLEQFGGFPRAPLA